MCSLGSVRLVNKSLPVPSGNNSIMGIVELCINNSWSRVCSESWDYLDAVVTCNQLGLPSHGNHTVTMVVVVYNLSVLQWEHHVNVKNVPMAGVCNIKFEEWSNEYTVISHYHRSSFIQ